MQELEILSSSDPIGCCDITNIEELSKAVVENEYIKLEGASTNIEPMSLAERVTGLTQDQLLRVALPSVGIGFALGWFVRTVVGRMFRRKA